METVRRQKQGCLNSECRSRNGVGLLVGPVPQERTRGQRGSRMMGAQNLGNTGAINRSGEHVTKSRDR